ncbi:centromere-associated protein E isoform X4 [Takifugu rubripes]|uniref:centromere-associated protein E isoform X4 n=1 Tax=Takifugu rubripes TaxID=31033 RepID=UPI00114571D4|nr:centromere-associated protein E isoform X4 [Takifugu rubripes]
MTEESAVKVCVRVRPLIAREQSSAETTEPVQLFWKADDKSIHLIDDGSSTSKSFCFDRVFTAEETTNHLYQSIAKPLVVSTVQGYNGTIFAYGQTSSGKTFTMMGGGHIPGVIPLAVEDVFQTIKNCPKKEFLLRVSYMEIYNETVTDLLVDTWKRKPLEVRETINKNIFVADLTEEMVTNPAQALSWISKGEKNRHYGKTKMNQRSSRSHTIFRMILESRERSDPASGENADGAIIVSHLNLVDLAGSERASQTGAEGARLKEGCNINRSLFTLGQVIKKLTDENQKGFTNYRDSKLTRILQNSLGGNAKTVIICTITPATLDETLSTLQFASTAKKMKNDPHVTEVSDDGALLKRYRNEIVDLKRRLHEVSSVTQTAATEKKVLSQLLQEKDQLQREQEDRIKNLTKLLVTSSNLVPFKKLPKRRVTWGGPMLRLAQPPACGGSGDLSFAEPFSKKWKPDRSCLSELGEEDEFDSNWEIPEEPSDVLEMSENGVTVRSFEESPKDLFSPDRLHELTGQVSKLEFLLEMESQQKKEAMTRVDELNERLMELEQQLQSEAQQKREALEKNQSSEQRGEELELQLRSEGLDKTHPSEQRAAELELQLQSEAQQKHEALEKSHSSEQRAAELELQLQSEAQQKHEALEKIHSSEQRAAELELQLQSEAQQSHEALEKIHSSEQRAAELELQLQSEAQQKHEATDKAELLLRVAELERQLSERSHVQGGADEQVRRDFAETIQLCEALASEKDLMVTERDYLKQELGMFLEQIGKLEKENALLSKELQEMKEVEEFESLEEEFRKEHEDVLQNEICDLRRAVEGSELQCQELQNKLESVTVELKKKSDFAEELQTMNGKDLVQEVAELRRSLHDAEGLGRDAKKEWAILRSQNLSLEESVVTLTASHNKMEAEVSSLRHQLSVEKSHNKQMQTDLQKELNVAFDENTKLTALLDGKVPKNLIDAVELERSAANLTKELTASREAEEALRGQLASLQVLPDQVQHLGKQLEQSEQQKLSLEEKINEMQQLLKDLEEKLVDSENSRETEEEISKELQEQLNELNQELQCERAEKEQNVHSSTETERLISSLTAERDQIRAELQDNVEKAAEAQAVLHSFQDDIQHHRQKNADLMKLSEQKDSDIENLSRELQRVCDELAEARRSGEEERQLQPVIDSLTAEQDQQGRFAILDREKEELQEIIDVLRQEKQQLKAELEDRMELVAGAQGGFAQAEMLSLDQESHEEEVKQLQQQIEQLQTSLQAANDQRIQLEDELQRNSELTVETPNLQNAHQLQEKDQRNTENERMSQQREAQLEQQIIEIQCHFGRLEEELLEQKQKMADNMKLWEQKESDLEQQRTSLTEQLESAQSERDALMLEKDSRTHTYTEEKEELHRNLVTLSKDREELQEMVEMLRQEKQQLRTELEDRMEMMQFELQQQQLRSQTVSLKEEQEDQQLVQLQQLQQHLESSKEEVNQLKSDLEENVELMIENQEELRTAQKEIRGLEEEIRVLRHQKSELEERQLSGSSADGSLPSQELQNQIQCLKEELLNIKAERDALWSEKDASCSNSLQEKRDLQSRLTSLTEEKEELQSRLVALGEDKEALQNSLISLTEEKEELQSHLTSLSKEKEELHSHLASLVEKKEDVKSSLLSLTEEKEELQSRLMALGEDKEALQSSVLSLSKEKEELKSRLMSLGEDKKDVKSSLMSLTEEKEELQSRLIALGEDNEALQSSVQSLSKEKEELQSRLMALGEDKADVKSSFMSLTEEKEELQSHLTSLSKEKEELHSHLASLVEEKEELQSRLVSLGEEKEDLQRSLLSLTEEKEELQSHLTSLSKEKEELKSHLVSLGEDKEDVKSSLMSLTEEKEELQSHLTSLSKEKEELKSRLESLCEEKEALQNSLMSLSGEKEELQSNLTSLSEEREEFQKILEMLRQEKQHLQAEMQERVDSLQTEISTVNKKMDDIKTERDGLMSEKEASCWASSQEQELQSRLTSLREEKEEMSELLEMVKREEQQLRTEMKCKLVALQTEAAQQGASLQMVTEQKKRLENDLQQSRDMVRTLTEKRQGISETSQENEEMQNRLASLGIEKEELQVSLETLQQEKQQLTADLENRMETISALQQETDGGEREAELQQLLVEANSSIAALQDQLDRLIKNPIMSQLQDSNKQIQEFLGTFQQFIEACSRMKVTVQNEAQRVNNPCPKFVPKSSRKSYSTVCQLRIQTLQCLLNTMEYLQEQAQVYRNLFEDLLKKDRLTFEEKCLQDVLLCRDQTYSFSVRDEDFNKLWRYRLTELLDKRNVYMKKMQTIWEKLWANMSYFTNELSAEVREHESFKEQLQAKVGLDQILGGELQRRSTMVETRNIHLQQLREENSNMCEELKCLQVQNDSELREERSRRCSMLQEEVQGAAFDTQQLLLKLQQAEDKVRLMNAEKQQLEKDQLQVHGRLSSHKEATQLLQTELQDSRAQVQDQDNTIQTLRNQLKEAQKSASPSAEELEHLRSKLLRADVELSSASEQHQKEIQKFKVLLNTKEESVRKLKELLRKSQQHGEESILQGEDLHARLTNPKGLNIRTSIAAEKAKLEEEVQQLQLKISELESQVSCQAAELSKWKSRAIKLKAKTKPELDKPGSPCTPTKRGLCSTTESSHLLSSPKRFLLPSREVLDSPSNVPLSSRKVLDSPKSSALDSPKSRFFDVGGTSDLLSRTFPKQFFDNSNLGLPQEVSQVSGPDFNAVDKNDEWWPRSPKQEDMCKTQ